MPKYRLRAEFEIVKEFEADVEKTEEENLEDVEDYLRDEWHNLIFDAHERIFTVTRIIDNK